MPKMEQSESQRVKHRIYNELQDAVRILTGQRISTDSAKQLWDRVIAVTFREAVSEKKLRFGHGFGVIEVKSRKLPKKNNLSGRKPAAGTEVPYLRLRRGTAVKALLRGEQVPLPEVKLKMSKAASKPQTKTEESALDLLATTNRTENNRYGAGEIFLD